MKKSGKKYVEASKLVEANKAYSLNEAVELVKKTSITKFDSSVEVAIKLNIDTKKADQQLRGSFVLPNGNGKTKRILVLAKGSAAEAAKKAGADFVGEQELIDKIAKESWFDYDVIIATPDMMPLLGRIGKVLGPRGLMPNPKTGTVTMEIEKAVKEVKAGRVEYRTDSFGNVHGIIGNTNFTDEQLINNMDAFVGNILRLKPQTVKGEYVKNISVSTTMGPGIKVSINSFDK